MKEKILNNCKKYWYVIGILVIAFIATGFIIFNKKPDYLVLKNETVKVELGTKFDNNLETYLDTKNLKNDIKKDLLKNAKISVDKKLKDSDYYSVGNYKVTISYKNQKEVVRYKVVDTTAPVITGVESIDVVQGTDLSAYDFASLFTVSDLAKVETKFDTSAVDSNTVNSYVLKINAKDDSKNETIKEVTVNIVQAPSQDEEVVSETVTNADGSTSVKTVTKKKTIVENNSNSNSSSNSSSNSKSPSSGTSSNSSSNKPNSGSSSSTKPNNSTGTNKPNTNSSSTNTSKPNNGGSSGNSYKPDESFKDGDSIINGGSGTGNWRWDENGNMVFD
ncbi:hypothetical protein [Thomasclavelia ramosa]|uniref:hypothetical protein n=1 Tax=Thomasclavelia ramosa TaxID=1547 RepID=UPI0018F16802|nr:hypothetical protein [Thomasclavelia ramosa]